VIPVVYEDKEQLVGLSSFSLYYNGQCVAVLHKPEFYPHCKEEKVCRQFGKCYRDQPYIKVKSVHESKI
jgi:3'-phosphoadenosine 5'-phosphosulfate synthase